MAIDSAAKRKGVAGIPAIPLGPNITPDATKAQFWRQTAAWGYGGILAAVPSNPVWKRSTRVIGPLQVA